MKYQYTNILGTFLLQETDKIIKRGTFAKVRPLPEDKITSVLSLFKDSGYFQAFRQKNLRQSKRDLKAAINQDHLINQTISNIQELDKTTNLLIKRLREWYGLYCPELTHIITNNEKLVELILKKTRDQILKQINQKNTFGTDFKAHDVQEMQLLAKQVQQVQQLRNQHEKYLDKTMKNYCPNFTALAGATIGAKLLLLGKSLKRLALFPASTIQLLGAEKALFRHIKTKSLSPKFGVIHDHPIVQNAKNKGKAARALADKLSLCARIDYFKGKFKADQFQKELEKRFAK